MSVSAIARSGYRASAARRVGLVGPLPPPEGGIANQTRALGRLLAEDGCVIECVQTNAPYRPAWVARVRFARAFFRLVPFAMRLWRTAGRVDVLHVMANSGWSWHLFAAPAVLIGRLRGVRTVVNFRGGGADRFFRRQGGLVTSVLRMSSATVVPSAYLEQVFAENGLAVTVIPNVVDRRTFWAAPRPARDGLQLVIARNLEPIYGVSTGLQAFAEIRRQLPACFLTIAGDGSERRALERLARDLGVHDAVTFLGRVDQASIARLYREADLLLNPSLVDNMPNSILEAQSSGLPVVTSSSGGIPFVVEDGVTGVLVQPGDASALAAAALRLLRDPAARERIAAAALAAAARYEWPNVRRLWFAAYGFDEVSLRGEAA